MRENMINFRLFQVLAILFVNISAGAGYASTIYDYQINLASKERKADLAGRVKFMQTTAYPGGYATNASIDCGPFKVHIVSLCSYDPARKSNGLICEYQSIKFIPAAGPRVSYRFNYAQEITRPYVDRMQCFKHKGSNFFYATYSDGNGVDIVLDKKGRLIHSTLESSGKRPMWPTFDQIKERLISLTRAKHDPDDWLLTYEVTDFSLSPFDYIVERRQP